MQAQASSAIPEPEGYRMENYRKPTPETLRGATVVDAIGVHALIKDNAHTVLVDVLPLERKPPNFPADRFWRVPPRYNLPNSVWLPHVGDGTISPLFKQYFVDNLDKALHAPRDNPQSNPPLVFYCLKDCWMSWNAAKRALALGYRNVYWFPGGTDEWEEMGYPLEISKAEKMPPFTDQHVSDESAVDENASDESVIDKNDIDDIKH